MEALKGKIILIIFSFFQIFLIFNIISVANNQYHNHNTNGEDDGNYFEIYYNPYDDNEFPGEEKQQRSGVEW